MGILLTKPAFNFQTLCLPNWKQYSFSIIVPVQTEIPAGIPQVCTRVLPPEEFYPFKSDGWMECNLESHIQALLLPASSLFASFSEYVLRKEWQMRHDKF
jgi:hypothetical protein